MTEPTRATQPSLFTIPCHDRGPGWAKHGDRVVTVKVEPNGEVIIRAGHITSTPHSHVGIDNVTEVVIWDDIAWREADNADDAHEKTFVVQDAHLIKVEDVIRFQEESFAMRWFGGAYLPEVIRKIASALLAARLEKPHDFFADLLSGQPVKAAA